MEWGGSDIAERAVLTAIRDELGLDADRIFLAIEQPDLKQQLKRQTAEVQARGLFGAPLFLIGGELFCGDDRLEQAPAWARHK